MLKDQWSDIIRPKALEVDRRTLTDFYGKFTARPLERGYGVTIGNSLRRILLSSLKGAAVTNIKIKGVHHEFATIAGVFEDVNEIILNIKELRFKVYSGQQKIVRLKKSGEGLVTGKDITCDSSIEVINPNQIICNLSKEGEVEIEMLVSIGRGYRLAEKNKNEKLDVDWINVDSLFSPVRRVNYTVSQARVGQQTDFDKLVLEIWTDGTINPENAIAFSSKILKDQLTVFINFEDEIEEIQEVEDEKPKLNPNLLKTVNELELSVRSMNCLQNAGIKFIYELVQKTEVEMLKTKNFGRKSLNEIREVLTSMGFGFGMSLSDEELDMIKRYHDQQMKEENT